MILVERVRKAYDKYALTYDAGTQLQRDLADKLIKAAQADCVKFSRVLDIGCGTGYLTEKLGAFGCDISFGMLSRAKYRQQNCYIQSDAAVLPFANSAFDLVVSNAAYQWAVNLKAAFKEARRVLRHGGKFYSVIFNNNTLWQLKTACNGLDIASSHFPDKDALLRSLTEAGFKINSIEVYRYEKYYKDLWELLTALKNIGSTSARNKRIVGLGWRHALQKMNNSYIEKFGNENGIQASYEAFLVHAE